MGLNTLSIKNKILICLGISSLMPFFLLAYYCHPYADDFTFQFITDQFEYLGAQEYWYNNWTARYFSNAILSIPFNQEFYFFYYRSVPIVLLISTLLAFYYLLITVFLNFTKVHLLIGTFFLMGIYLLGVPSTSEILFWLPASVTYQLASILFLVFLSMLIKIFYDFNLKYFFTCVLCVIFIIGCNETSMLILDNILAFMFFYRRALNKRLNPHLIFIIIIALIASGAVYYASGNITREKHYLNSQNLNLSITHTFQITRIFIIQWLQIIMLFGLTFIVVVLNNLKPRYKEIFNVNPAVLSIFLTIIVTLSFFIGYWYQGFSLPDRAISVLFLFFFIGVVYLALVLFYNSVTSYQIMIVPKWVKYVLVMLCFLLLFQKNNIKVAYSDLLSGRALQFHNELKNRYNLIEACADDSCDVPRIKLLPESLPFEDVLENDKDWRGSHYSNFFGKSYFQLVN